MVSTTLAVSPASAIHPSLVKAYRLTRYELTLDNKPALLSVGCASQPLASVMSTHSVSTAAWLTAFNPASAVQDDQQNTQAQQVLVSAISAAGYAVLEGRGASRDGQFPAEQSVLALGMPQHVAESLADRFGQNAYLWVNNADAFVSLKLCKPLLVPEASEIQRWIDALPSDQATAAKALKPIDQAWLMSIPDDEVSHWLLPAQWDLNQPWPLAKPDGSAMGIGTELDRMFRIIAAGQVAII